MTDNFNFVGAVPIIGIVPVQNLFPLGTGSALSALTSTINTVNTAFLTSTSAFVSAPGGPRPDQQGGGAWSRVIAGTVELKTSSTGTIDIQAVVPLPPGAPATGTQNCKTTTSQDYVGYQVGRDISVLNMGGTGANWHWGVTAGYLEAKTKDITPAGTYTNFSVPGFPGGITFTTPAGSFQETSQVPFAGLYTAFTKGDFFADGQICWDFFQNTLSDRNNGLSSQGLNAHGISVTANSGYNIRLHNNWFIEPSGGVVWSRVQVDPLNVPGLVSGGFLFARGTVTVDDIESVLGRASVRVGTTFSTGQIAWQPYFTASVFHEFAGDVKATSLLTNADPAINNAFLTTRSNGGVGTYGQFALGTAAVLGNSGWLGYGRVDYRNGDVIEGWGVNAGLRYQFSPEQRASVKDDRARTYAYNWTGFYGGMLSGSVWGDAHQVFTTFNTRDTPDFAGWFVGGLAGYNLQHGRWVYGIEADYGFSNARGSVSCPSAFNFTCTSEADHLASVAGRVGFTWDRALFYAKGGWAGADITMTAKQNAGVPFLPSNTPINGETKWMNGWTIGAGVEFAIADRWSVKAEYMHFDLGKDQFTVGPTPSNAEI